MNPAGRVLSAQELLAGTQVVHDVPVPWPVLRPAATDAEPADPVVVRLRPLSVGTLVLVAAAARDDPALVPVLIVKESLVEPRLDVAEVRGLPVGLLHFLVTKVHEVSGLTPDGDVIEAVTSSPLGRTHLLLAKHFGWSPDQVAQLTPGQVAVYLAGIQSLLRLESGAPEPGSAPGEEPTLAAFG